MCQSLGAPVNTPWSAAMRMSSSSSNDAHCSSAASDHRSRIGASRGIQCFGTFARNAFTHSVRLSTSPGAIAIGVSHAGSTAIRDATLRMTSMFLSWWHKGIFLT